METRDASLANGIRVGRLQQDAGLTVTVNANDILHRFFNGDPDTAHIDEQGNRFFDDSFDPKVSIGCPFAINHRIPEIRDRVVHFAAAYRNAGIRIDLGNRRADRMERSVGSIQTLYAMLRKHPGHGRLRVLSNSPPQHPV
jgi:hypothetical protein